ncbi:MAG: hypothetical protein OXP07_17410 [Defluviicoccus sp.]|nr:hypothetical protein [Defluviicoccus sp.]
MSTNPETLFCSNEACQFSVTAQCVEGHELDECPYLGQDIETSSEGSNALVATDEQVDGGKDIQPSSVFTIEDGKTLLVARGSEILKSNGACIVAFIGQAEAGKTSLIAEVYDAFQYSSYSTLAFAGSRTLIAFEKICHKVRATSRASDLLEERTDVISDPVFYHLRLKLEPSDFQDMLIADRSGETYRDMLDRPELVAECLELHRATVVNVLVDGKRLSNLTERSKVMSECHHSLQTLMFCNVIKSRMRINIILTKLDLVDVGSHKKRAHDDFRRLGAQIKELTDNLETDLGFFEIAARPENDKYPKGYGVEALIADWLKSAVPTIPYQSKGHTSTRSFEQVRSSREEI